MKFSGSLFFWRGPAPYFFVSLPEQESQAIKAISRQVTYGWGAIPVEVQIGKTAWETSLFPKDGRYLVPIRAHVMKAEDLNEGDEVTLRLEVVERRGRPAGKKSPGAR